MRIATVTGLDVVKANLSDAVVNQIPYAISRALNSTAKQVMGAESSHVSAVFNRPKPFTVNAFGAQWSSKTNLLASVFAKDIQNKYLAVEEEGGTRGLKTFEQIFAGVDGAEVALPGVGVKTDQYGNITRAQIKKIATELAKGKSARYFKGVPKGSNLPAGVYLRDGKHQSLVPQVIFANTASYQPKFKFYETAQQTFVTNFQQNMSAAMGQALSNMKK